MIWTFVCCFSLSETWAFMMRWTLPRTSCTQIHPWQAGVYVHPFKHHADYDCMGSLINELLFLSETIHLPIRGKFPKWIAPSPLVGQRKRDLSALSVLSVSSFDTEMLWKVCAVGLLKGYVSSEEAVGFIGRTQMKTLPPQQNAVRPRMVTRPEKLFELTVK